MVMKKSRNKEKKPRLTVTLDGEQRQKVENVAQTKRVSAGTVIRWAVDEHLHHEGQSKGRKHGS